MVEPSALSIDEFKEEVFLYAKSCRFLAEEDGEVDFDSLQDKLFAINQYCKSYAIGIPVDFFGWFEQNVIDDRDYEIIRDYAFYVVKGKINDKLYQFMLLSSLRDDLTEFEQTDVEMYLDFCAGKIEILDTWN